MLGCCQSEPFCTQGPVSESGRQCNEVVAELLFDVLCYCICNVCYGLTIECLETGRGILAVVLAMRVCLAQFVTESMLKKQMDRYNRMS